MANKAWTVFGGRRPKIHKKLLPDMLAQTASDCDLEEGILKARKTKTADTTHAALTPKTLYKQGTNWRILADGLQTYPIGIPVDEAFDRFIFGDPASYPKQTDSSVWTTLRRCGVLAPTAAPTIAIQGAAGDDTQDIVSYVYTMVTSWGEESAPSPVTAVTTVTNGQHIHLSNLDTPAGAGYDWEYKRIYRLSSGVSGAEYMYLDEIAAATTTYNDDGGSGELKDCTVDALATTDWDAPPTDIIGFFEAHNGMILGYESKTLYVSEPYVPYAYPEEFTIDFESDITGVCAMGGYILVVTKTRPYVLSGNDPETLVPERLPYITTCDHQRSMIPTERGIFFSSPEGLMLANTQGLTNLTKDWIDVTTWQSIAGSTVMGIWWNDKYYGFKEGAKTGFIVNIEKQELTTFTMLTGSNVIRDVVLDAATDNIYLLYYDGSANSYTCTAFTNSTLSSYVWKSKVIVDEHRYNCVKIKGDFSTASTSLEFKLIVNGTATKTKKIFCQDAQPTAENTGDWWFDTNDSDKPYYWTGSAWQQDDKIIQGGMFKLPTYSGGSEIEIQLSGNIEVESVQIATAATELT